MKLKTLIQAGCSFLAFIFVFLPWYVIAFAAGGLAIRGSENAFGELAIGVISLLVSLVALAWFVVKILISIDVLKIKLPFKKQEKIIDTVAGGLVVLFGLIGFIVALANNSELIQAHPGFGVYLYILAGAALCALPWIKLDQVVGGTPKKAAKQKQKEEKKETKKGEK